MHYVKKYLKFLRDQPMAFFGHWVESKSNCINQKYLIYCWLKNLTGRIENLVCFLHPVFSYIVLNVRKLMIFR